MGQVKVYMVRHGKTGQAWSPQHDHGLDSLGRKQAQALAASLADEVPLEVISSPLARSLESAEPLLKEWGCDLTIEPRIGEIPFPADCAQPPMEWLREAMTKNWLQLPVEILNWKSITKQVVLERTESCVIFTHYLTIAAVVSELTGAIAVDCFDTPNCTLVRLSLVDGECEVSKVRGLK